MRIKLATKHWRVPLLFQSRVYCDCGVGVSVRQLLCADFALSPEYIDKRVETVFLNGQPLDDLEKNLIRPGDRLVLAAGLPGVTGICMRRNSPLQSYRDGISVKQSQTTDGPPDESPDESPDGSKDAKSERKSPPDNPDAAASQAARGRIELALFSLLMRELYEHFLRRGIWIEARRLHDLLMEDEHCRVWLDDQRGGWLESTRQAAIDALALLPAQEQVLLSG